MPRFSEEFRYPVILKMKEEVNQKKVARELNMSRCTVRKIWLKFLKTGTVSDIRKSGRPCLLSEMGHRDLVILTKKSSLCGSFQLLESSKCYPNLSKSTISDIWDSLNFLEERLQKSIAYEETHEKEACMV